MTRRRVRPDQVGRRPGVSSTGAGPAKHGGESSAEAARGGDPMCDSFVAITDDGVMFAKNSDRDPNESQSLEWIAAADHPAGDTVACTWVDVPQVEHTHAVVISRPWWMWGAEMGANEHGVVIGNEAVFTKGRGGEQGPLGDGPGQAGTGAGDDGRGCRLGDGRPARTPRPGWPLQLRAAELHLRQQLPGGRSFRGVRARDGRTCTGRPRRYTDPAGASPTGSPSHRSPRPTAIRSGPGWRRRRPAAASPRTRPAAPPVPPI